MTSFAQDLRIIKSLTIRDLMGRFGRQHLGFVWTILEPMILTAGVMLLWSMIKEPEVHGVPVVEFVMTGYMPLTLWRHLTGPMARILRNNSSLLYHQSISILHILLARVVLEFLSVTVALIVIYFVVVSTGIVNAMENPALVLCAWLLGGCYFSGLGLIIGGLTEIWDPAEKFVQPMQYLALPISGVFFMVDWLPKFGRDILLFNPSVHYFEMFRAGFLGSSFPTYFSVFYLASAALFMNIVGFSIASGVGDRVSSQ